MMKMRQQPDNPYSNKINKQNALFLHHHNHNNNIIKHGAASFINLTPGNHAVDHERDESPVSVISHSASVISQPSSACTSMEHHLMLNPNLTPPKAISTQNFANSHYAYKQDQFSVGTSAASTSEDDSSAYNLPTLFFEVQEEISKAQKAVSTKKVVFRNSSGEDELGTQQQQSFMKPTERKSFTSVSDSLKSDDDDHMISIDLQGLQESSSFLREKFINGNGNKLIKEEEKQTAEKLSAKWKQYDEWKRDQKLDRSPSNGLPTLVERPYVNESASKITNFSVHHTGDRAISHVGIHEGESLKGPQSAQRNANSFIEKAPPSLASRQKSINSTKSSKWDDAEKWLCYDNHVSHHHKVKNSLYSGPKLHNENATLDQGVLSVNKASSACKDNHPSPRRGNLSDNKIYEYKDKHGLKDDVACATVANHLMMQSIDITPGRRSQSIADVMSRSNHACASHSPNSNGLLKSKMLEDDTLKRDRFGTIAGACVKGDLDYMSSGEIVSSHVLSSKFAASSVSDGEIHANNASNCHASQMLISGRQSKKKDYNFKTTFERWRKDNSHESAVAQHRARECDYLSSGELVSQANNRNNLAAISTSDGEMYTNYASDQQYKSNASYTQRFKQHQLLQKLRRKCSPSNGWYKGAVQHVREDGGQNFTGKNAHGRVASVHAASRLSISTQASPHKDQLYTQGQYTRTQSVGKLENEMAREESVCINAGMQREFVVQTPTHGRSASMKDACTEVSPTLSRRDMGTQMTPSESSPITSKCTSPMQNTSPARHNTPTRTSPPLNPQMNNIDIMKDHEDGMNSSARRVLQGSNGNALELESCHWAKLELPVGGCQTTTEKNMDMGSVYNDWSPGICLQEEIVVDEGEPGNDAVDETHSGGIVKRLSVLDATAAAWEDAERAKFHAKYKREEARINAWETLQKAKAEAELKRLEVKLERLRSRATEKVLSKVAAAEKRAEEMRAAAEAQQAEQMRKVRERACNLRKTALFPGSFAVCFARNYMP